MIHSFSPYAELVIVVVMLVICGLLLLAMEGAVNCERLGDKQRLQSRWTLVDGCELRQQGMDGRWYPAPVVTR